MAAIGKHQDWVTWSKRLSGVRPGYWGVGPTLGVGRRIFSLLIWDPAEMGFVVQWGGSSAGSKFVFVTGRTQCWSNGDPHGGDGRAASLSVPGNGAHFSYLLRKRLIFLIVCLEMWK